MHWEFICAGPAFTLDTKPSYKPSAANSMSTMQDQALHIAKHHILLNLPLDT